MPRSCGPSRPRPRPTASSTSTFIEPELREDRGEIEAAAAGTLPRLIELGRPARATSTRTPTGPTASTRSSVMADAARARGHAYQVLTDHSQSLAIARGLTPDRVELQRAIFAGLNARYAAEEAAGTAPADDPCRGVPPPPRLRARDPGRRSARLRGRPPGPVRPGRRVAPRRAPPAARPAHRSRPDRDPQPARRRHRPPGRPDDPDARRPRPRLGHDLRRGRPDRHGPRDERLRPPARPVGRARAPGAGRGLPARRSTPTPTGPRSSTTSTGRSRRPAGPG